MARTSLCYTPLNRAMCLIDASCVLPIFIASSCVSCSFLHNDSFRNPGKPGPTMSCSIIQFCLQHNTHTNRPFKSCNKPTTTHQHPVKRMAIRSDHYWKSSRVQFARIDDFPLYNERMEREMLNVIGISHLGIFKANMEVWRPGLLIVIEGICIYIPCICKDPIKANAISDGSFVSSSFGIHMFELNGKNYFSCPRVPCICQLG